MTVWGGFSGDDPIAFALGKRFTVPISDYAGPDQGWVSLFAVDPKQFLPDLPIDFDDTRAALRDRGFETQGRIYDLQRDIRSFEPWLTYETFMKEVSQ
jgi:hypothetical protein